MTKNTSKRPRSFKVGRITLRALRGPKRGAPDLFYWRAEWYPHSDGSLSQRSLGWMTKDTAIERAATMTLRKIDLDIAGKSTTALRTVSDLMRAWFAHLKDRVDITDRTKVVRRNCAQRICEFIADVEITELTTGLDLERFVWSRLRKGDAVNTIHFDMKVLFQAVKWAYEKKYISIRRDEIPRPKLPTRPTPTNNVEYANNHRTPSDEEAQRVCDGFLKYPHQHGAYTYTRYAAKVESGEDAAIQRRALFLFLWSTGCRIGAALEMTWGDIDFENEVMVFRKTKTKIVREVYLLPHLADVLKNHRPPNAKSHTKVFTCHQGSFRREIARICEIVGIQYFTPHGLRRRAVNKLIESGIKPAVAAHIAGHDVNTMMKYYRLVSNDEVANAMRKAQLGTVNSVKGCEGNGGK